MKKKYVTKAIMLHGRNYGEADRIMVAFTKEKGRVDFMARGVRKIKSKNRGLVQPFTYSEIELVETGGMDLLTQGVLIEGFMNMHRDFDKMVYTSFLGEFLMQVLPVKEPYQQLCYIFLHTLNHLDKRDTPPEIPVWAFVIKAVNLLGYRPQWEVCAGCSKQLVPGEDYWYSFSQGCLYCGSCSHPPDSMKLSPEVLRTFAYMENMDLRKENRLHILPADLEKLSVFLQRLLLEILEREQKSAKFIRKLKEMRDF